MCPWPGLQQRCRTTYSPPNKWKPCFAACGKKLHNTEWVEDVLVAQIALASPVSGKFSVYDTRLRKFGHFYETVITKTFPAKPSIP